MTNILNSVLANQPIRPQKQDVLPAFTFDTHGKTKPLEYKGELLPSKIFTSPKEYAHDLKNDVLSLGKAAKGQANDYELGRINDLAMKAGSLGLATYLLIKNPLKLSKAMEFIGVGTFFGGMALWPKIMIQAPLRARTGVDIHQKYIDSQGRKKMLHQDPQYDLTDLYSRQELDLMGEKLKVNKNLPDRDNFIKQRAKKVAVQGNTLWMMSAFVTPIISALSCKALEEPVGNLIEAIDLSSSASKLEKGKTNGFIQKIKNYFADKAFEKFLKENANKPMNDKFIDELSQMLSQGTNSASVQGAVKDQLKAMRQPVRLTSELVINSIRNIVPESVITSLTDDERILLSRFIEDGNTAEISKFFAKKLPGLKPKDMMKTTQKITSAITKGLESSGNSPMSEAVVSKVTQLRQSLKTFASQRQLLDNFIDVRLGKNAGSFNARQWEKVFNTFLKSLKLSDTELKAIADGDMKVFENALSRLAKDENRFNKTVEKLFELINKYEEVTGAGFTDKVAQKTKIMCQEASDDLTRNGFNFVAKKIKGLAQNPSAETVEKTIITNVKDSITGEASSFYRLLQIMDMYKQNIPGYESLAANIQDALVKQGVQPSREMINKLVKTSINIVQDATTADQVTKLAFDSYNLSPTEYKVVMDVLYKLTDATSGIDHIMQESKGMYAAEYLQGFRKYRKNFFDSVASYENSITPKMGNYVPDGVKATHQTFKLQNNLIGSTITDSVQKRAKSLYNTNKWLKIFGISFAVIATVTLVAGLTFGRKSKMEKEAEKEIKGND